MLRVHLFHQLNQSFTHHLPFLAVFQPIEREGFGAGRQDRPVASQEEQSSDGAERLPGGARGADRRGGAPPATPPSTRLPHMLPWQRAQRAVFPQVAQLHHELNLKDELLQFYTSAAEESEDESCSSPTSEAAL